MNGKIAALVLAAAGSTWPSLYGALTALTQSPLQRANAASWCGGASPHVYEAFGHCAVCWVGAALFFLAAALSFSRHRVHAAAAA